MSDSHAAPATTAGAEREPLVRAVMPELDSVRGVAVLMVVFYHAFAWSEGWRHLAGLPRLLVLATLPGWIGVNLFFVLSGFLITGVLMNQRERSNYYRSFYVRRALRIVPACYATLLVLAVTRQASWPFLTLSACYLSNLSPLFGVAIGYGPLWSLAVEEHFYLIWPSVVRTLSTRGLFLFAAGIVAITPVLRVYAFRLGARDSLRLYTWLTGDGLALGAMLAVMVRTSWCTRKRLAWTCTLAILGSAAAVIGGAPFGILTRHRPLGAALQTTPWNVASAAVLGLVLLVGTSGSRAVVNVRGLRFFGEISYGLYLFHLGVFMAYDRVIEMWRPEVAGAHDTFGQMLVRFLCAGGASVAIAWASRRSFEEFFLRLKDRLAPTSFGDAGVWRSPALTRAEIA